MLRVFLVEDESIIRETLRDTVPWARCGYTFVGEAADGEMALPLIRKARPDVLITDIRMPFMDGLSMSKLVLEEFPDMKIIIISGYDDFEYARQAIRIGVEQYLLKPITKATLMKVLREVREKIEQERVQQSYQTQFQQDSQAYEQYARRSFMERVVAGHLSVQQIYEEAGKLGLDLRAQSYCLAFFSVLGETYSESDAQIREALLGHFMKYPEYLLLRWNLTTYMVLLKGDADKMEDYIQRCIDAVQSCYSAYGQEQKWYVAVGQPTRRLSALPGCFEEVSRLWAYRYIQPQSHILTAQTVGALPENQPELNLSQLDVRKFTPSILLGVMQSATESEIPSFVGEFLLGVQEALGSKPFCQYLMLSARFTATEYILSLGLPQEEFLPGQELSSGSREELRRSLTDILIQAVKLRDRSSTNQYRDLLSQAVAYIDSHFADEKLSLNQVAREVNISANYLSAVFSQEMDCTFIEYVTGKRMARARELLRTTDKRSGEVATEVGYKDPHYFSFLFKKTQGCTPQGLPGETRMRKQPPSISRQMQRLVAAFSGLTLAVLLLAVSTLAVHQTRYQAVLHNLTRASEFNQDFKTDIDLKMYYNVIESRYSEGLPVSEIHAAQALARELLESTTDKQSLQAITSVLDLSENLERKINQIRDTESYDERQVQLENNVYVLTALIQEYMYDYLYSEAVGLNALQRQMNRRLILETVLIILGAGAVFVLLTRHTIRLSRSIALPIAQLSRRVQQIGSGDLSAHTPVPSDVREVSTLGEGLEQMAERMGQLIQETTEKQQSLRHAELALLQAQINPHFLYNTMDTIIWLMEAEKNQEAVEMVSNLSSFFRHSLSKGADIITLSEEESQVRSYLQIQQVRYKDILTYEIDIAPEIRSEKIPKLTLQPLVENALYHGVKLKRGGGRIWVTGRLEGSEIVLKVSDSGIGMTPERLAQLRSAMERGERVGFGLSTVHERLKLFFGPDYGLLVESTEGAGTVITARIPAGKEGAK